MTSAGTIGTLRRPETRATAEPDGSWLSRAIENSIRIVAVCDRQAADEDRDRRVDQEDVPESCCRTPA